MPHWLTPDEIGLYEPVSRSMRIEGYSTSVRLERVFWDVLDQMAGERQVSTCGLIGSIYHELHMRDDPLRNFSSVLRVICMRHMERTSCAASNVAGQHLTPSHSHPPSSGEVLPCPSCGIQLPH